MFDTTTHSVGLFDSYEQKQDSKYQRIFESVSAFVVEHYKCGYISNIDDVSDILPGTFFEMEIFKQYANDRGMGWDGDGKIFLGQILSEEDSLASIITQMINDKSTSPVSNVKCISIEDPNQDAIAISVKILTCNSRLAIFRWRNVRPTQKHIVIDHTIQILFDNSLVVDFMQQCDIDKTIHSIVISDKPILLLNFHHASIHILNQILKILEMSKIHPIVLIAYDADYDSNLVSLLNRFREQENGIIEYEAKYIFNDFDISLGLANKCYYTRQLFNKNAYTHDLDMSLPVGIINASYLNTAINCYAMLCNRNPWYACFIVENEKTRNLIDKYIKHIRFGKSNAEKFNPGQKCVVKNDIFFEPKYISSITISPVNINLTSYNNVKSNVKLKDVDSAECQIIEQCTRAYDYVFYYSECDVTEKTMYKICSKTRRNVIIIISSGCCLNTTRFVPHK